MAVALSAMIAACSTQRGLPVAAPPPANAVEAGVRAAAPPVMDEADARAALMAFRLSCAAIPATDPSGLTQKADWAEPCAAAAAVPDGGAGAFFRDRLQWIAVGGGKAFATGYFEPEIAGSKGPVPGGAPIYGVPADLTRGVLPDGKTGRGRVDAATGQFVPYYTRAEIEDGALAGRGLELAWAVDPADLFFLEIQGSGRVRMTDGEVMRIGYADQNGRAYVAIGRLLRERGILAPGKAGMAEIRAWMAQNPDAGRALMRENGSKIFFRVLTGPGPVGSMGVPVTARASVAVDPSFVPMGAPVRLTLGQADTDHLWIAQDRGGAIKGANRFDTFWGAGAEAAARAGGLSAPGMAVIAIPRASAARLGVHAPSE